MLRHNTTRLDEEQEMTEIENKPDLYCEMKSRYWDVIEGSRGTKYRLRTWSDPDMCETECTISNFRDVSEHVKVTVVYQDVDGTKSWEEGSECFLFDPDLHDAADVLDQAEAARGEISDRDHGRPRQADRRDHGQLLDRPSRLVRRGLQEAAPDRHPRRDPRGAGRCGHSLPARRPLGGVPRRAEGEHRMPEVTPLWWRDIDDPLDRYERAVQEQAAAEEAVTRLSDLRARCLAELHYDGWSYAKIAEAVGISRARVQQLVERGSDVTP